MWLSEGWRRRLVIAWSIFAGVAVLWDFSWCFVFRALQSPDVDHGWRRLFAIYGHIDHRYLQADPWLIILEIMTGLVGTTLNFYVVHQLLYGSERRARVALLVVSVTEIYGTVMYWGSELFSHFVHVGTASWTRTLVMFVGLNSLWLIFPGWCVYRLVLDYAAAQPRPRVRAMRRAETDAVALARGDYALVQRLPNR